MSFLKNNWRDNRMFFDLDDGSGSATAAPDVGTSTIQTETQASSSTAAQPQSYTLKVNGKEQTMSIDEVITHAQKGLSADEKFQQAAEIRKEHDKLISNINRMVTENDYDTFENVFGADFGKGLSSRYKDLTNDNTASTYSEEDIRMAEDLELDVDEYIRKKNKVMGLDNPMVSRLSKQMEDFSKKFEILEKENASLKRELSGSEIKKEFTSLSDKYPYVDKRTAASIIEQEKVSVDKFEEVFKILDDLDQKRLSDREKDMLEKKKREMRNVQGVNVTLADDFSDDLENIKGLGNRAAALRKELGLR